MINSEMMLKQAKKIRNWNVFKKKKKQEKTFSFQRAKGPNEVETYTLKESQLDQQHLDLLYGEFLRHFDSLPRRLHYKFISELATAAENKQKNG